MSSRLDCHLRCGWATEVSPVDPDVAMDQFWSHLLFDHAEANVEHARALMRQFQRPPKEDPDAVYRFA